MRLFLVFFIPPTSIPFPTLGISALFAWWTCVGRVSYKANTTHLTRGWKLLSKSLGAPAKFRYCLTIYIVAIVFVRRRVYLIPPKANKPSRRSADAQTRRQAAIEIKRQRRKESLENLKKHHPNDNSMDTVRIIEDLKKWGKENID